MIDFKEFYNKLYIETKRILDIIIEENKSEKIYGIGYYYSGLDWNWIMPCILTEKDYIKSKEVFGVEVNEFIIKWSYSEKDSFEKYEYVAFEEINDLLSDLSLEKDFKEEDFIMDLINIQNEMALSVLETLKNEGFFNRLNLDNTIINMWSYEQENSDLLNWSKRLNTKKVHKKFEEEFFESINYDLTNHKKEIYNKTKEIFLTLKNEKNLVYGFVFDLYSFNKLLPFASSKMEINIEELNELSNYDILYDVNYEYNNYLVLLREYRDLNLDKKSNDLLDQLKNIHIEVLERIKDDLALSNKNFVLFWNDGRKEEKISL